MSFIVWVIGKVVGLVSSEAFGAIAGKVADTIQKRADVDLKKYEVGAASGKEVVLAAIQGEIAANRERAEMAKMFFGWGPTRWLIFAALVFAILHQSMVLFDSSCPVGWHVMGEHRPMGGCGLGIPKAPPPYDEREWLMIATLFGIQKGFDTVQSALFTFLNRFKR